MKTMKTRTGSLVNTSRVLHLMIFLSLMFAPPASSFATQSEGRQKGKQGGSTQTTQSAVNKGPGQCDPNVEICNHEEGHQDPPINARMSLKEPDSSHIDYDEEMVVACPATFWAKFTFKARKGGTWYYRFVVPSQSNLKSEQSLSKFYPLEMKTLGDRQTAKFQWTIGSAEQKFSDGLIRLQLLTEIESHRKRAPKGSTGSSEVEPEIIKIDDKDYVVSEEKRLRVSCSKTREK